MSAEKQYPWLSQHRIAKPCKVQWTDMSGDEKERFCGQCKLNVYNLSAMTSSEAESLLQKSNGRVCTYFYQRADGTVLTQDCPVGLRQVYRQKGAIAAALYVLSLLVAIPLGRAEGGAIKGDAAIEPPPAMLGGAPPVMPTMGEPLVKLTPTPTSTATPTSSVKGKKAFCPRPLLGKPAVRK